MTRDEVRYIQAIWDELSELVHANKPVPVDKIASIAGSLARMLNGYCYHCKAVKEDLE